MKDEVMTELWAVKDAIAREHNYDIDALFLYFKEDEQASPSGRANASKFPVKLGDIGCCVQRSVALPSASVSLICLS